MANVPKKGLDYFPLEVSYFTDPKTELIFAEFKVDGEYLFIRLLTMIYGNEGYYCEWNRDKALILASKCGFSLEKIELILTRLVERSMFDEQLFHSAKVLTSRRIQKVYIRACSERQSINIREDLFLLGEQDFETIPKAALNKITLFSEKPPINQINPPINSDNPPINLQSKEKESKEKESTKDIRRFGTESFEYKCAEFLTKKILEKNPSAKVPKDYQGLCEWADHIEKMIRIDKRPEAGIQKALDFAVNDGFWRSHILSTRKLREKFDTLYMQALEKEQRPAAGDGVKKTRFSNCPERENDYSEHRKREREYIKKFLSDDGGDSKP